MVCTLHSREEAAGFQPMETVPKRAPSHLSPIPTRSFLQFRVLFKNTLWMHPRNTVLRSKPLTKKRIFVWLILVCLFVYIFPEVLDMKSMSLAHAGQTLLSFSPSASILLKTEPVFSLSPRVTTYALDCPLDWSNPHPREGMRTCSLAAHTGPSPSARPHHLARSMPVPLLGHSVDIWHNFLSPHLQREDWQVTVTS